MQVDEKIGGDSEHKSPFHKRRASNMTDLDPNNLHSSIGIDDVSSSIHIKDKDGSYLNPLDLSELKGQEPELQQPHQNIKLNFNPTADERNENKNLARPMQPGGSDDSDDLSAGASSDESAESYSRSRNNRNKSSCQSKSKNRYGGGKQRSGAKQSSRGRSGISGTDSQSEMQSARSLSRGRVKELFKKNLSS